MSDTVSANSIRTQMPHNVLTRVLGEPTHKQIKMVIRELTANLMAVSCPLGHGKGHCLLQDPTIYAARNGEAFTIPANEPPAYPVMPNGATAPQREELHANNIVARKAWATYKLVLATTHNQLAAAIDDVYYPVLDDPTKGLNSVDLCTLVHTFNRHTPRSANQIWTTIWPNSTPGLTPAYPLRSTHASKKNAKSLPPTPAYQSPTQRCIRN